ncbi:DUF4440 domain-containing protein [Saccharothrix sp. ALI-22-I]|uniref:YybH family protein n=1 Tax=Saccharothrix sp. ALI-22-I TaxID=1933778 RepID=UPI00097C9A80|nr:nuclear transport factor 2 family protein [Saccharothrix sp. ALI-22-I]ONI92822.1 DUF4440 domain-containing protein [Saccharothrix sp. ALI-22-I]
MTSRLEEFELTGDATRQTELYVRAFNSGNVEWVHSLYTEDAVAVWEPGKPLTGEAHRRNVEEAIARGASMQAKTRHAFVTGDTALLIVDWTMDATNEEGVVEHLSGVGVDVLRLGEDGKWRYAIDDPYGEEK